VNSILPNVASSFIMRPHPDDFDRLDIVENLIDETMLYVDSSGIGTREVSYELFEGGRILVRFFSKDIQQSGDCGFET
jgi:hypothetical protein